MRTLMCVTALALALGCAGRSANEPSAASVSQEPRADTNQTNKQVSSRAPCKRAGCSGELCVSVDSEKQTTACAYRPEFDCYKSAQCELQQDGRCGWTETEELRQCLERAASQRGDTRLK